MRQFDDLYFTTATILNWHKLLVEDIFKDTIIDSFRYCVQNKRANIWAFVIMENHIHLVWHILPPHELINVRQGMLKYTSQKMIALLIDSGNLETLDHFRVNRKDRTFQIWERNPLSVGIYSEKVLKQKIDYIHNNLLKKGKEDVYYKYSSASYYATGIKNWDFL